MKTSSKVIAIICVWTIFVFGAVYYTRHNKPVEKKITKTQNTDSFIVGSIRVSLRTIIIQTKRIPSALDEAYDGRAAIDNPLFTFVLRSPVTVGWQKSGNEYISPSGQIYIYDNQTSAFLEGFE